MKSIAISLCALFALGTMNLACVNSFGNEESDATQGDEAQVAQNLPSDVTLASSLMAQADAQKLQGALEARGYQADMNQVSRSEDENGMFNLVVSFSPPAPEDRSAALVFHLQTNDEVQAVTAMTMTADAEQVFYVVRNGQVLDTRDLNPAQNDSALPGLGPQDTSSGCDWWVPYGCGECRWSSIICATKNKPGYFWGIKWGTCGTCNAPNENGCC